MFYVFRFRKESTIKEDQKKYLEDIYQKAGVGRDSLGLTYQDLKKLFGASTPSEQDVACFDDGDRRYSLMELRAAVGL
ncbi:hypothetical protein ILYODFUR_014229 [Ilyodon furcidens]|uniref:Uncharacterized protein n=1 Tax=Ilyodon furcidens TaxID=33524 RepID=A0ABV0TUI4_9TELE